MNTHLTEGELRAALDHELPAPQAEHLQTCAGCRARLSRLQAEGLLTARKLSFLAGSSAPAGAPASKAAWQRFTQEKLPQKEIPMIKQWFSFPAVRLAAALVLILTLVLAFPGTRALADQLLSLFRVQQVAVVPVDFTGLTQLTGNQALGKQLSGLISSSLTVTQEPGGAQSVSDAASASSLAGFNVRLPQGLAPSQMYVTNAAAFSLTIDRAKTQALLNEAGRSDLALPASIDGEKVSIKIPASVSAAFGACPKPEENAGAASADGPIPGRRYPDCIIFAQLPSPSVNAPADLDVAQLAQIGLEFTGMTREQAAAFTSTVDWTSTLVVPIPKNAATYQQVAVDGVTGTLIQRPADDAPQFALMWVKGGIVYAISGLGTNSQQALQIANSLP